MGRAVWKPSTRGLAFLEHICSILLELGLASSWGEWKAVGIFLSSQVQHPELMDAYLRVIFLDQSCFNQAKKMHRFGRAIYLPDLFSVCTIAFAVGARENMTF